MPSHHTKTSVKRILLTALFLVSFFCFTVEGVYAQGDIVGVGYLGSSGLPSTSPVVIVARIIDVILGLLGIVTTILVFYAGFLWLTSAGNEDKIDKAKQTLSAAVLGLVIVMTSYAISRFALSAVYRSSTGRNYPTSLIQFR